MKTVRILLVLCSAVLACNRENPVPRISGDDQPLVKPQLRTPARSSCPEPIKRREKARELLVVAEEQCLDRLVKVFRNQWPDDLAAAYLVRAERNDTPADLLRALDTAKGVNRAMALQQLGLTTEAIAAWNEIVAERSEWSDLARRNRDALQRDPMEEWRRLHATPRKLAQVYPAEAAREQLDSGFSDVTTARIVAEVLAAKGDPYLRDVLAAFQHPGNDDAMRAYRNALRRPSARAYEHAAVLLEKAGNPLHLYARFRGARLRFLHEDVVPLLDALIPAGNRRYPMLLASMHTLRAGALEQRGSYPLAYPEYDEALRFAGQSATQIVAALSRRSLNYMTIGSREQGFHDAVRVLHLLPRVPDARAHADAYASAAETSSELGFPKVALLYRNALIEVAQKAFVESPSGPRDGPQHVLAVALRARAETHAALQEVGAAQVDLRRARELTESLSDAELREPLHMRLLEAEGDALLMIDAAKAAQKFGQTITRAEEQHSTYRAVLHFKLAEARRRNGDPRADDDLKTAFKILRNEARQLLDETKRGEYENLWSLYFARFQDMHRQSVRRMIEAGKTDEAFIQDEQARAFEPLYVLQSRSAPPGFESITSRETLDRNRAELPADTVILQYLVLPDRTYVWLLRRGEPIQHTTLRVTEQQIDDWREAALEVVSTGQEDSLRNPMRAVYAALFHVPLRGVRDKHLVIIPDGPMHGLPFAALESTTEGYLLERVKSIATDGSTSRYLYARKRDAQFRPDAVPSVLLAAATVFNPAAGLDPLKNAQKEVDELRHWYPQARVLSGANVTEERFLDAVRGAAIVHFAGHAIPVPRRPWTSQLLLASGELTAEKLMRELSQLERTRLVVLGACSTAGGQPVGPEGLAPLVRPLIAAKVPGIVGTLWNVKDATAKELLVSLHCHYRHGDDVAVALREAQLEMLRKKPAMWWAPYQVVGYAGSPYARGPAMEKTPHDSVCAQHSLQRPDGLHPE